MITPSNFYCDGLSVSLKFSPSGGLSGLVDIGRSKGLLTGELSGLYVVNNKKIRISFFSAFVGMLHCFSGEIFKYGETEHCLILKVWPVNELLLDQESFFPDHFLMFDLRVENTALETEKVIGKIPTDIFV